MSEEKSKFKVGDRVVCIDDKGSEYTKIQEVYTIKKLENCFYNNTKFLYLEELPDGEGAFESRFSLIEHEIPTVMEEYIHNPTLDTTKTLSSVDSKMEGKKDDSQKPDMTDIPLEAMWEMGQAFTYGQKKYGKNNYRNGMKVSRQLAAAIRHIYQHLGGETKDSESGAKHLGHAMASLAMAIYNLENNPEMDDRFEKDLKKYEVKK